MVQKTPKHSLRAASASAAAAATAAGIPCACCLVVADARKQNRTLYTHDLSQCQRRHDQTYPSSRFAVHSLGASGVDGASHRGPARAEEQLDGAAARGVGAERARRSTAEPLRSRQGGEIHGRGRRWRSLERGAWSRVDRQGREWRRLFRARRIWISPRVLIPCV